MTGEQAYVRYVTRVRLAGKAYRSGASWERLPPDSKANWDAWAEGYSEQLVVRYPDYLPERDEL